MPDSLIGSLAELRKLMAPDVPVLVFDRYGWRLTTERALPQMADDDDLEPDAVPRGVHVMTPAHYAACAPCRAWEETA